MKDIVVYDSSCGLAIFNYIKWFIDFQPLPELAKYIIGDGIIINLYYISIIELIIPIFGNVNIRICIKDVVYSPSILINLLLIRFLFENGLY